MYFNWVCFQSFYSSCSKESHGPATYYYVSQNYPPTTFLPGTYEVFMSFPGNHSRVDFMIPSLEGIALPYLSQAAPSRGDIIRHDTRFQLIGVFNYSCGMNAIQFSNTISHGPIAVDAFLIRAQCDCCGKVLMQDDLEALPFSLGTGWLTEKPGNHVYISSLITTKSSEISMLVYNFSSILPGKLISFLRSCVRISSGVCGFF